MMAASEDNKIFKNLESHWKSQTEKSPNFRALFGCPVCKEVANPPIFVCLGGHIICSECHKKHKECPKCKSVVSTTHSEFAEKFMSTTDLNCKYEDDGCNLTVKATEFRNHIIKCPNRPIKCFLTKCAEEVPFKKFFRHLTSIHSDKVNGIENNSKHIIEWWIDGDPTKTARWPPFYLTCFGNVFLYMAISTKHGSWEWAWVIANEDEAKRFRIKSTMDNKTKNIGVQWSGGVHSIRTSIHEILATGLVFVTSTKELQNPFMFGKSEEKSKHFWRSDVEIQEIMPPPSGFVPYLSTEDDSVSNLVSVRSHEFLLRKENLSTQSTLDIRLADHEHEHEQHVPPVIKVSKDKGDEKSLNKSESSTEGNLPGDDEDVGSVHGSVPGLQEIIQELPPPPIPTNKIENKSAKTEKIDRDKSLKDKTVEETQPKKNSLKDKIVKEPQPNSKAKQSKGERENLKIVKNDKNSTEIIYTNSAAQTLSIEALEAEQRAQQSSVEDNSLPTNKPLKAVGSDSALPYYADDGE